MVRLLSPLAAHERSNRWPTQRSAVPGDATTGLQNLSRALAGCHGLITSGAAARQTTKPANTMDGASVRGRAGASGKASGGGIGGKCAITGDSGTNRKSGTYEPLWSSIR